MLSVNQNFFINLFPELEFVINNILLNYVYDEQGNPLILHVESSDSAVYFEFDDHINLLNQLIPPIQGIPLAYRFEAWVKANLSSKDARRVFRSIPIVTIYQFRLICTEQEIENFTQLYLKMSTVLLELAAQFNREQLSNAFGLSYSEYSSRFSLFDVQSLIQELTNKPPTCPNSPIVKHLMLNKKIPRSPRVFAP